MNISDLAALKGFETAQPDYQDASVTTGYTSDLLSDVMANAPEGCVLITIQAHKNTVAVAALAGVHALVICHRRPLPADMLEAARIEGLAVFITAADQFEASCRIQAELTASTTKP